MNISSNQIWQSRIAHKAYRYFCLLNSKPPCTAVRCDARKSLAVCASAAGSRPLEWVCLRLCPETDFLLYIIFRQNYTLLTKIFAIFYQNDYFSRQERSSLFFTQNALPGSLHWADAPWSEHWEVRSAFPAHPQSTEESPCWKPETKSRGFQASHIIEENNNNEHILFLL